MNVEAHVVVLELREGHVQPPHILNLDKRGKDTQTVVLVGWVVEEVHTGESIGNEIYHSNADQLLFEKILHVIAPHLLHPLSLDF